MFDATPYLVPAATLGAGLFAGAGAMFGATLKYSSAKRSAELAEMRALIESLHEELGRLSKENKMLSAENKAMGAANRSMREAVDQQEASNKTLRAQMRALHGEIGRLRIQLGHAVVSEHEIVGLGEVPVE